MSESSTPLTLQEEVVKLKEQGVNVGNFHNEKDATEVVRFSLDTDFLNKFTARQWGIVPKKPVVIQLKFEEVYTAAEDIPGIFIFQSGDTQLSEPTLSEYETEFGVVQWFLETRLTEVLRSNWEKRPASVRNYRASSPSSSPFSSPSKSSTSATLTNTSTTSNSTATSNTTSTASSSATTSSSPSINRNNSGIDFSSIIPIDESLLSQLTEVGFSDARSRAALQKFTNDFEMALNYLLTNGDSQPTEKEKDDIKMEIDTESNKVNENQKTPTKKRTLTLADDDNLAKLYGMGFDMDTVSEAIAVHPSGTSVEEISKYIRNQTKSPHTPKKQKTSSEDDEKIEVLKGLGFSPSEAANALDITQGNLAKAVELMDNLKGEEGDEGIAAIDFEEEVVPLKRGRGRGRRVINPYRNTKSTATSAILRDSDPDDIPPTQNEVNLWTDGSSFLVNLYNYISMRFITCPGYCLICDRDLDISTYKLPVCGRAECKRVYESTACGTNQVIAEIKEQPAVVELLLNLLCACITSPLVKGWNRNGNTLSTKFDGSDGSGNKTNRHNIYAHGGMTQTAPQSFEPFPYNLGFEYDDGTQNIPLLQKTIDAIPPVDELQKCSSDVHLQAILEETASPLAFPLLRWLLRSSRSHLSLIPTNKQIVEMGTPYQFQIVSTNPEHERTFQKWKQQSKREKPLLTAQQKQTARAAMGYGYTQAQYIPKPGGGFMLKPEETSSAEDAKKNTGSFHAFHGSPISNWHSIVRTGLRGGHVPGIYMAQAAAVSQGYMQSGGTAVQGWKNSTWDCNKSMSCMGMAEVADMCHHQRIITGGSPLDLPAAARSGIVNVAMDYSIVVTRYLFFWPRGLFPDIDPTNPNNAQYMYTAVSPLQNIIASKLIKNEFLFLEDEETKEKEDDDAMKM